MAAGKTRVQSTIEWELHAGPLHLRCRKTGDVVFLLEARGGKGWAPMKKGTSPLQLLRAVVMLPAVGIAVGK
jgi:hypothetical protein